MMEAVEFLKEYNRMCRVNWDCSGCPLKGTTCSINPELSEEQMINIVDKTEQWSKEHPIITNAMKFKEVFGHKPQSINGIIFCPPVTPGAFECDRVDCMKCLEWWDKQYKEPENA